MKFLCMLALLVAAEASSLRDMQSRKAARHAKASSTFKRQSSKRPNIVVVHADDLGYNDIGYRNPEVITPNLDALAKQGIILENNYVPPVCTPSRHAFMTGVYPFKSMMQHGVLAEPMPHCSPNNIPFLPERLATAGYKSHIAGKWHLGFCKWECTPTYRGFDSFYGLYGGKGDFYTHFDMGGFDWRDNEEDVVEDVAGEYATDLITGRALDLIYGNDPAEPMFLWLTYTAPHSPLQVPDEYLEYYPDLPDSGRKTYLAMMTSMDEGIGAVVEALKETGMWENTFFVFSSDNGGENGGQADNSPRRGGKASLFEGGANVLGFTSGPLVTGGKSHSGIFSAIDWVPTLLSIAGVSTDDALLDGIDQSDMVLNGGDSLRDEVVYNIDLEPGANFGNAALRQGNMKLIWGHPGYADGYGPTIQTFWHNDDYLKYIGKTNADYTSGDHKRSSGYDLTQEEKENQQAIIKAIGITNGDYDNGIVHLFDLSSDPNETTNLADDPAYAKKVEEMQNRLKELISDGYVKPHPLAGTYRMRGSIVNGSWAPGWCNDVTIEI